MSKSVTLQDLHATLKPMLEAITRLREETTTNTTQVSEIHQMMTNLSCKLDTMENAIGTTYTEVVSGKKTTSRKPAAKKAPAKRATKKAPAKNTTKKATEDIDDVDDDNVDGNVSDVADDGNEGEDVDDGNVDDDEGNNDEKSSKTKKVATSSKAAASKATTDKANDVDESTDVPDTVVTGKKLPVKMASKLPVKGKVRKSETDVDSDDKDVKDDEPKEKPINRPNKMNIFRELFKSTPERFDAYLTQQVKKEIAAENKEKWGVLKPENRAAHEIAAYYKYFSTKHDKVLEEIKAEYLEEKRLAE